MLIVGVWAAWWLLACPLWADTISLKDGRQIEGHVVRADETQVIIVISSRPEAFAREDVESIRYSRARLIPSVPSPAWHAPAPTPGRDVVGEAIVAAVKQRLHTSHEFTRHLRQAWRALRVGDRETVRLETYAAAKHYLPLGKDGSFDPIPALAQLLILLGLRIPVVWLALVLVREPRGFTRIAEFFVPTYGLIVLLMALCLTAANPLLVLGALFLIFVAVTALFIWMFALPANKALMAITIVATINVGFEHVFVHAGFV